MQTIIQSNKQHLKHNMVQDIFIADLQGSLVK